MKKIIVLAMLVVFFNCSLAQKPAVVTDSEPGWQKIGETTASFKKQNESIHVLGADEFTSIRIKVLDAPLSIERLQVFYESGEMEDIDVESELQRNEETSSIRLKYPDKGISKVAFTYQSSPNSGGEKANVVLLGLKAGEQASSYRDNDKESNDEDVDLRSDDEDEEEVETNAERVWNDIDSAAEDTGDQISETAAKGAAELTDVRLESKVGPDGQTIYVDDSRIFYYISEEGERVNVNAWQLKDKPGE